MLYAAPAYFALGILARDLARRATPTGSAILRQPAVLALAIGAVFAAYPTGMAVVARGMPDISVALFWLSPPCVFPSGWRGFLPCRSGMMRTLASSRVASTLALALSLFGMFLFRRWYAFAAAGILTTLALEIALLATMRGAKFHWREAISAAALGGLILIALGAPILIDWLPDPGTHDYVTIYAAYRKDFSVLVAEMLRLVWRCAIVACRSAARFSCGSQTEATGVCCA